MLSVPPQITPSDNPFGIFWSLYFLFFLKLRLLIALWYLLIIVLSVPHQITAFDNPFGIFWLLYCLFPPQITPSDYPFGIFWSLYCLFLLKLRLLITLWYLLVIVLSVPPQITASDRSLVSFGHCIVCSSSNYGF